jgi:hypothetical protein
MKYEQCKHCRNSLFKDEWSRPTGFINFLFWSSGSGRTTIHCSEICSDIDHDQYCLICNIGCGSFKDNDPNKKV